MSDAMNPEDMNERLLDLMMSQATEGLAPEEERELERLLRESGMSDELEKYESTATAFDLGSASSDGEPLPDSVRDKLLLKAGEFFGNPTAEPNNSTGSRGNSSSIDAAVSTSVEPSSQRSPVAPARSTSASFREALAWITAAACLVFGLWIWNANPATTKPVDVVAVVDATNDKQASDWTGVHTPEVTGQIVWSQQEQAGYMVFENLPINDPLKEQYQLWIFDGDVNQEVPIDGGVFDVSADSVTVPFTAKHPVGRAVQFAVTVERPGGVQRSQREKIPVLAKLPTAE